MDDGTEEEYPIGMVILKEEERRDRDRDRDREKGDERKDRDREKGDDEAESGRDRDVASGKDYARRPVGYKSALAQKREVGQASARLIEEETFVRERPIGRRDRSRSRERKRGA